LITPQNKVLRKVAAAALAGRLRRARPAARANGSTPPISSRTDVTRSPGAPWIELKAALRQMAAATLRNDATGGEAARCSGTICSTGTPI
jgi:hypothetical protein